MSLKGRENGALTCYPLGHDVCHLTAGGEHPHAQLIDHQHLEAERPAYSPNGTFSLFSSALRVRLQHEPSVQNREAVFPRGQQKFAEMHASFSPHANLTWELRACSY